MLAACRDTTMSDLVIHCGHCLMKPCSETQSCGETDTDTVERLSVIFSHPQSTAFQSAVDSAVRITLYVITSKAVIRSPVNSCLNVQWTSSSGRSRYRRGREADNDQKYVHSSCCRRLLSITIRKSEAAG